MKLCDFCGVLAPGREYDAGSTIQMRTFMESGPQLQPTQAYDRIWAACDICGQFLDRNDIQGLKARVWETWEHNEDIVGLMSDPNGRKMAKKMLDSLYDELAKYPLVRTK